jgi:hypothetical protein
MGIMGSPHNNYVKISIFQENNAGRDGVEIGKTTSRPGVVDLLPSDFFRNGMGIARSPELSRPGIIAGSDEKILTGFFEEYTRILVHG